MLSFTNKISAGPSAEYHRRHEDGELSLADDKDSAKRAKKQIYIYVAQHINLFVRLVYSP